MHKRRKHFSPQVRPRVHKMQCLCLEQGVSLHEFRRLTLMIFGSSLSLIPILILQWNQHTLGSSLSWQMKAYLWDMSGGSTVPRGLFSCMSLIASGRMAGAVDDDPVNLLTTQLLFHELCCQQPVRLASAQALHPAPNT